jgi:hypothetical protein
MKHLGGRATEEYAANSLLAGEARLARFLEHFEQCLLSNNREYSYHTAFWNAIVVDQGRHSAYRVRACYSVFGSTLDVKSSGSI